MRLALQEGLLSSSSSVLDYGCGHGEDVRQLQALGFVARGWDPVFRPDGDRSPADVVNLGYVANVIESIEERAQVLSTAWKLANQLLIVAARSTLDDASDEAITQYGDGVRTRIGSFQKYYDQHELRTWIQDVLKEEPFPAAPGIFMVFRDQGLRETWRAHRFRRRIYAPRVSNKERLFQEHRELLEQLMDFLSQRGRLPRETEVEFTPDIRTHFGSFQRAFQVIRAVTGETPWQEIQRIRKNDLLVWLALGRFQLRPAFSTLPGPLQGDIKALFGAYSKACAAADEILLSIGDPTIRERAIQKAPFGKVMPQGLYVHIDHLEKLPVALRLYEGCARAFVGGVPGANLVKLHRDGAQISYLTYTDFERDPHPELLESVLVSLDGRKIRRRNYRSYTNRFILHRKETFIPADDPLWPKFRRLTAQEERWGLFGIPSLIGTSLGWRKILSEMEVRFVGHRLVRVTKPKINELE